MLQCQIAAVLFPTPETLDAVEALASVSGRPLLLVNAQWQPGQVSLIGLQFAERLYNPADSSLLLNRRLKNSGNKEK